jgi:hypothetical protein
VIPGATQINLSVTRGAAEKAAGIGYGSAVLLSLCGFVGGAAYVWHEREEEHKHKLKGLAPMAPFAGLSLRQLCGVQWFEIGGIKLAPQSQLVGTTYELKPEEVIGSKVASASLHASSRLLSLWAPHMSMELGSLRPHSKHAATAATISRPVIPEWLTATGSLWVLDAGTASGDRLRTHDTPDWVLVVNGSDRRAAWLLSRSRLVTTPVQHRALEGLQALGFDIAQWRTTAQALPLYGGSAAAAAAMEPAEDLLDTEDQAQRTQAARRAAASPPAITELAQRAYRSSRAAALSAGEEMEVVLREGIPPSGGGKSPHEMAMHLLGEVQALRAASKLQEIKEERQVRE